jgi:hypothetical protein
VPGRIASCNRLFEYKFDDKSRIIAESYWDFHEYSWKIRNMELSKEEVERLGVK